MRSSRWSSSNTAGISKSGCGSKVTPVLVQEGLHWNKSTSARGRGSVQHDAFWSGGDPSGWGRLLGPWRGSRGEERRGSHTSALGTARLEHRFVALCWQGATTGGRGTGGRGTGE